MASRADRRERSDRYDDDDDRRGNRRREGRGDVDPDDRSSRQEKKPKSDGLNEYFMDGQGINREVLQREICRFLGPEAYSKPSLYKGVDGFLIKAVRPFTVEMRQDLIKISKSLAAEREDNRRRGGRGDLPYVKSDIGRHQDLMSNQEDDYSDEYDDPEPSRSARHQRGTNRGPDPYGERRNETYDNRPEAYDRPPVRGDPTPYPPPRDPYAGSVAGSAYGGSNTGGYTAPPPVGAYGAPSPYDAAPPAGYGYPAPAPASAYPPSAYGAPPRAGNPAYEYRPEASGRGGAGPYTMTGGREPPRPDLIPRQPEMRDTPMADSPYETPASRVPVGVYGDDYGSRSAYPGTRGDPSYGRRSPEPRDGRDSRRPRNQR